ncbi:MAG TPA: response regulator [Methanolinea sp.]|jgi:CheY-like chemotaxis protein|nr:MAG: response regulator PleD [Methanoregulaceae archaeon PtaB.Bin009]OPY42222.1 MAG: response regulator PleD [Methanoregulaceae archaeon PtaU1.Bin066]HII76282.1 response regulator [Methanolinea sp.]HNQ28651.1 response regulator [Methanolinea sp.]HNS83131.1 response regulator [Methanolinea sp.]
MYRILIVDDNPAITDILARMVRHEGLEAIEAHSGEEALAILGQDHPDLIFLDILMEPMDGWETLDRIKRDKRTADIPVMMITAKSLDPAEVQAHTAHFEDYIQKPVTRRELCRVIRQYFRKESEIIDEVEKARLSGMDAGLVDEFRRLSRDIEVHQRLLLLLWNVYRTREDDDPQRPDLLEAIGRMEAAQNAMRSRHHEIRTRIRSQGKGCGSEGETGG